MSTTSQVIVNVDTRLKKLAMKKAKQQGIPFSSVLKFAIKAFIDNKIKVALVPDFNPRARREIKAALRDIEQSRNLSPEFTTVKDAVAYLID